MQASTRSFPAATTTAIPALLTRSIASLKTDDLFPPILKLSTACVFGFGLAGDKIQSNAATTPVTDPLPLQSNNLIGTIVAFFATP